jgi:hypothetical protein
VRGEGGHVGINKGEWKGWPSGYGDNADVKDGEPLEKFLR